MKFADCQESATLTGQTNFNSLFLYLSSDEGGGLALRGDENVIELTHKN